jgi:hypothetical protein
VQGDITEDVAAAEQSVLPILGSLGSGQAGPLPGRGRLALFEQMHCIVPLRACLAAAVAALQRVDGLSAGRAPLLPARCTPQGMAQHNAPAHLIRNILYPTIATGIKPAQCGPRHESEQGA